MSSSSSGLKSQRTEYVFNKDFVPLFTNLTFRDVSQSFTEYRALLQRKYDTEIFRQLNEKLDEIEFMLAQKEADIQAAHAASHKIRLQLYDLETQYYQNPKDLHVLDETFINQSNTTDNMDHWDIESRMSNISLVDPHAEGRLTPSNFVNSNGDRSHNTASLNNHLAQQEEFGETFAHKLSENEHANNHTFKLRPTTGDTNMALKSSVPSTPEIARAIPTGTASSNTPSASTSRVNGVTSAPTPPLHHPTLNRPPTAQSAMTQHESVAIAAASITAQDMSSASTTSAGRTLAATTTASTSRNLPWHIKRDQQQGFLVVKIKGQVGAYSNKLVEKLIMKINSARSNGILISSGAVTKRGNIRLSFAPNITFHDLEIARAIPISIEPIDCSDWLFLSIHGVPLNEATGKQYTGGELRKTIEGFGLKLARTPELMGSYEDKGIAKISFSTVEERDAAYFMRAFYFEGQRAKLRIFPDEWYNCDKFKAHGKDFKNGRPLADLRNHDKKLRVFQTNCKFDLQVNHEILFETMYQAHIVMTEGCWKHSDGRPLERQEWMHFYEQYFYEQGGTRMALYASRRPYQPAVAITNTYKPFINSYFIADFLLIQIDRPSDLAARELFEALQDLLREHSESKEIIIAGCFNLQHKMWDGSEAPPEMYANRIADLLSEFSFKRLSPFPSKFIDSNNYYTNPTVLFAQRYIANRIHVHDNIVLSNDILEHVEDYHYLSWDVEIGS
ncbi:uncharacterized protein SAPINGB_P004600 [Magnusiomyces paraingens]|uniref:Uncharacterized protein n=1 Tax=Magnusiomyces paraingens TaxID=2606893 RepID=A0A5E8C2S3_9ASCO|nr:uncharacterized protein SAPINGB_P004600 [Saprochaete ingens]VVT55445.1 unnamed protein product [Saprochaete ingens]